MITKAHLLHVCRIKTENMADKFSFKSTEINVWRNLFRNYEKVMKEFCKIKTEKKPDSKFSKLKGLDDWFQNSLGKEIKERETHHLIKTDLVKLMEWKLTRGKFRPRLSQMIAENPEDLIRKASEDGFKNINNTKVAIEHLCKLKAVGPATASAILTAYCPEKYAFMADEAVQMVLTGKIDYTLKYYLSYLKDIQGKAKELTKKDTDKWTPHQVEIALWTFKMSTQFDIQLDTVTDGEKQEKKKRKENTDLVGKEEKENSKRKKI